MSAAGNDSANRTFYHGTSLEAALSIQNSGFDASRSGSNAGTLLGNGVYVTDQLSKAMNYTEGKPHGGCVLQLDVDIGNCLHLSSSNLHMKKTWHSNGYDSAHAAEEVLSSGSKEEYCIGDARRVKQLEVVTLCDAGKARAAGFKTVTNSAGPPNHCNYWTDWSRGPWLQKAGAAVTAVWEWEDDAPGSGKWRSYDPAQVDALSAAFRGGEPSAVIQVGATEYFVDFGKPGSVTQTNVGSGFVRAVQCNSAAVHDARREAIKAAAERKAREAWRARREQQQARQDAEAAQQLRQQEAQRQEAQRQEAQRRAAADEARRVRESSPVKSMGRGGVPPRACCSHILVVVVVWDFI